MAVKRMRSWADLDGLLPAKSHSPEETLALGSALAKHINPGDVVALYGDLGAGKTVFARGVCEGLGFDPSIVGSPTFTILNEYGGVGLEDQVDDGSVKHLGTSERHRTNLQVFHFDAYRIDGVNEFYQIGYEEYFFGEGICIVEWADKIEALLPDHTLRLLLEHAGGDLRRLSRIRSSDESRSTYEDV